jgi:hypothetical protein
MIVQEYVRLLSEAFYASQLFWYLNLAAEIITMVLLRKDILNSWFMMTTALFNLSINLTLIILMLNTKKRSKYNKRLNIE